MRIRNATWGLGLLVALAGCGQQGSQLSEAAQRGRSVYVANCIACHASDPTQNGALGPELSGTSRELLEARVLRAEYPPGYTPKRSGNAMVALPHLEPHLDDLYAYLSEVAP